MLGHVDTLMREKPLDPVDADILRAELGLAFAFAGKVPRFAEFWRVAVIADWLGHYPRPA
jgi:hypothetical protein